MATNANQSIQGEQPAGITCSHYEALPGRKHCRHYLENGACSRPDEFMCIEWLKANGHAQATPSRVASVSADRSQAKQQKLSESSPVDLFGNPNPDYKPKRTTPTQQRPTAASPSPAPRPTPTEAEAPIVEAAPLRGFTDEDIASFKALGVQVCIESEAVGEVWLVPAYTDQQRKELTPDHAATIARVVEAFPGSRVVSFDKKTTPVSEAKA